MHIIHARNVNGAFNDAMWYMHVAGVTESSRNGEVLVAPGPVCTVYTKPQERVLFSYLRDANPYFHFMEALWMLAGHEDVEFLEKFNSKIGQYSDNGQSFWGAYGYRWRCTFGYDQLDLIVGELKKSPDSRRCVLAMWDAFEADSEYAPSDIQRAISGGKDVPCNTHAYFDCRGGVLNMTVCNRSNDAVWGCYGANVVHFSMLQEYLAVRIGVPMGVYRQFSNNFHVYKSLPNFEKLVPHTEVQDYYYEKLVYPSPLMLLSDEEFRLDLERFLSDPLGDAAYREPFFNNVAAPMAASWFDRKLKKNTGVDAAQAIEASDWRTACLEWIARREEAKREGA